MTGSPDSTSEPFPNSSGAVSEHIAARRLGVSLDMLRRDRRTGKLGIPFIKIGEGKRGLVRYDLADLERWVAEKKRVGRAPQAFPVVAEPAEEPAKTPVEPRTREPDAVEPRRTSPPQTPWEAMAETVLAELEDDPFSSNVVTQSRRPGGYFSG